MSDVSSDAKRVPWGPWEGILLAFGGLFVAQIVAVLLITFVLSAVGVITGPELLETTALQFVFVLVSDALIMGALWLFSHKRHSGLGALGFGRGILGKDIGYAALGYLVYFVLLIVVLTIAGALSGINLEQKQELGFDTLFSRPEQVMAFVSLVLLPPFVEEILFRGFLFAGLRTKLPFMPATVVTSLLFGGLHLLGVSEGVIWVAALDTFVLSFVLCYLREKTGALWAPIAVHMLKNAIAFYFLLTSVAFL